MGTALTLIIIAVGITIFGGILILRGGSDDSGNSAKLFPPWDVGRLLEALETYAGITASEERERVRERVTRLSEVLNGTRDDEVDVVKKRGTTK